MTASRTTLAQRRAQLLTTIANEREMTAASPQVWRQPLAVLDVARSVAHFVHASRCICFRLRHAAADSAGTAHLFQKDLVYRALLLVGLAALEQGARNAVLPCSGAHGSPDQSGKYRKRTVRAVSRRARRRSNKAARLWQRRNVTRPLPCARRQAAARTGFGAIKTRETKEISCAQARSGTPAESRRSRVQASLRP